jgi:hypothetical protein
MQQSPTLEWLTIAAIILGPVLALFAQRALDWLRTKRAQRVQLYLTLMRTRATPVAPEHVNALNTIDVVFNGRRDRKVRDFWHKAMDHINTIQKQPDWNERYFDLKADMLREMGLRVGYDFSTDYLKRQAYYPIASGIAEADALLLRTALTKVVTQNGLRVQLVRPSENSTVSPIELGQPENSKPSLVEPSSNVSFTEPPKITKQ